MFQRISRLIATLLLCSFTSLAVADSNPETSGYGNTVIARVFLGDGGNLSFLRFLNLSGNTATVSATLIGSPSGNTYGTTQISIANRASKQIAITDLLSAINMLGPTGSDDRIGVYLKSDAAPVAVQHVLYSQNTGFFENMTTCQNSSVSDSNAALMNVHTTSINDYVSYVTIYNYANTPAVYDVQVYEAATGAVKGLVSVTVSPNSTFEQPFSWFQDQLQWTPAASEYQANIVAFPQSGSRGALIFHTVYNNKIGIYLNLTNFCTVESSASSLPVANNDNLTGAQAGQPFAISFSTLTSNDQNATGASLLDVTTPMTNGSANGTLSQSGNDLTLTAARSGIATFQYRIHTSNGNSSFGTVSVNVSDGTPFADGDRLTQSFVVGTAATIPLSTLMANDRNTSGAAFVLASGPTTNGAANGTMTVGSDSITYTPASTGTVSFTYQLRNSIGLSNTATVYLTVGTAGAAPVAVDDALTLSFSAGQTTSIPLTALTSNDLNAGDATFAGISTPMTGGVANGGFSTVTGGLAYTPSQPGTVTFTYQLRNSNGLSNNATVTLTVGGTNAAPVANNDSLTQTFTVGQTTTIPLSVLTANDQNITGAVLDNVGTPLTDGTANGTITASASGFAYTPARAGGVTFTYQIRTAAGLSNAATARLVVTGTSGVPVANNDVLTTLTFTTGQPTTIPISLLLNNDTNTTDATFTNITSPMTNGVANGTFSTAKGALVYTPLVAGGATFTYQLRNASGLSNVATVSMSIGGTSGPVANNDTLTQTFTVGQTTTIPLSALTANDSNATGATLDNVTTPTTDGTANGTIIRADSGFGYTPSRAGVAIFTYQIRTSAGLSNTATVRLTVSGATGVPVANSDSISGTFVVGQQATILLSTLTANDQNASGATLDNVRQPTTDGTSNGTMTMQSDRILYTPARAGLVTFGYQLRNSAGLSNAATVVLTVTAAPSSNTAAPVANNDSLSQTFTVGQQTIVQLSALTANDLNASGATLYSISTPTTEGTANGTIYKADSAFAYTPARAGTATFTYQISTSAGVSNTATVVVTVRGVN